MRENSPGRQLASLLRSVWRVIEKMDLLPPQPSSAIYWFSHWFHLIRLTEYNSKPGFTRLINWGLWCWLCGQVSSFKERNSWATRSIQCLRTFNLYCCQKSLTVHYLLVTCSHALWSKIRAFNAHLWPMKYTISPLIMSTTSCTFTISTHQLFYWVVETTKSAYGNVVGTPGRIQPQV